MAPTLRSSRTGSIPAPGLFAHDRAKLVLALGLTLTLGLASMMVFVEPDWADPSREEDLESSEVFGVLGSDFGDQDAENTESFQLLIHHPGLDANDSAVTNLVDHILEPIESEATVTVLRAWKRMPPTARPTSPLMGNGHDHK